MCCGVDKMKKWITIFAVMISWQVLPENSHSQGTHNAGINTENANEAGNNQPFSIPVRILEAPLSKPDHEKDREQRRRQEAREEENLATQKNIAKVSEKLSHYTLYQLWLSIASAFGLTLTVVFAGLAWKESKTATNTAKEALKITENTSKKQLRAYLTLDSITCDIHKAGIVNVGVVVLNCGQTPAFIDEYSRSIVTYLAANGHPEMDHISTSADVVVGPSCHHTFNNSLSTLPEKIDPFTKELLSGERRIRVHIKIGYTDIFGEQHSTEFMRTNEPMGEGQAFMNDFTISDVAT